MQKISTLVIILELLSILPSTVHGQNDYWQQFVHYNIDVSLNTTTHFLSGTETILYRNNSPDILREIYLHLYPNAFKDANSTIAKEAKAAGCNPQIQGNSGLRPDCIIEVKPTGTTTGEIVWEWHVWDHLIQDHDPSKANYGDVAAHPQLIDLNYVASWVEQLPRKELDKLRSLGYLGSSGKGHRGPKDPLWTHTNSVAYHAELDQIVLSVRGFNEIWIIDHSTTTQEAASHRGGRSGKGGDLLYRWGNPQAYRAGTDKDQQLFGQHDAHWIPPGLPGEGHVLLFNKGYRRPQGSYSSVDEPVLREWGRCGTSPFGDCTSSGRGSFAATAVGAPSRRPPSPPASRTSDGCPGTTAGSSERAQARR